jgi:hypothetical protein
VKNGVGFSSDAHVEVKMVEITKCPPGRAKGAGDLHTDETRKRLAKRIKELQPSVSDTKAAQIVGVKKSTIHRGANAPIEQEKVQQKQSAHGAFALLSGTQAANLVKRRGASHQRPFTRPCV